MMAGISRRREQGIHDKGVVPPLFKVVLLLPPGKVVLGLDLEEVCSVIEEECVFVHEPPAAIGRVCVPFPAEASERRFSTGREGPIREVDPV